MLPGLQSFCVYAAAAIFAIYALQVIIITHVMAINAYDDESSLMKTMIMIMVMTYESYDDDDNDTGDAFCGLVQLGPATPTVSQGRLHMLLYTQKF